MTRKLHLGPFAIAALALALGRPLQAGEPSLSLTYLDDFKIKDQEEGLTEPSGLTVAPGGNELWTVSDDTRKIFNLQLDGDLRKSKSFKVPADGLEGITLDTAGEHLFTVSEDDNEIIQIHIDDQTVIARRQIAEMAGFDELSGYFEGDEKNKGLEGIAWNAETNTVFVVKEGPPGLIVEISGDLTTILGHQLLNEDNGFFDDDAGGDAMDFSGICFDRSRDRFWIVSHEARRLFLYDWKGNRVVQSFTLGYGKKGEYAEIDQAEGVAVDPGANRLYVVSDVEARLYVFDLRE